MKKVKIILTLVTLSLIIVINGCGAKLKTAPWSDDDVKQMEHDDQKAVPLLRLDF